MRGRGREGGFLHLNVDGAWGDFEWRGLELDARGGLGLAALPDPIAPPVPDVRDAPSPKGPAGVVETPAGTVYFTDPDRDLLFRRSPCDGEAITAPCVRGTGYGYGQLREPRGLAYHGARDAVLLVDSGNHRILLLDGAEGRLVGVWGQPAGSAAGPGAAPGRFDRPWTADVDGDGHTYVLDAGNRRIQKLDLDGRPVDAFRRRVEEDGGLVEPADLAVGDGDGGPEIHVIDPAAGALVVFDADGRRLRRREGVVPPRALGLAVDDRGAFLGDNGRRRVMRLLADGESVGPAPGYAGPISALTLGRDDRLWLLPGAGQPPVSLTARGAHARAGALWGGPFGAAGEPRAWHQLEATGSPPGEGSAIEFYIHLTEDPETKPGPPAGPAAAFPPEWSRLPQTGFHGLLAGSSPFVWIGARLLGDGTSTPRIEQIRLDHDVRTWIELLPALYREDDASRRQLNALLALSESIFDGVGALRRDLPRHFEARSTPATWLDWLASWLALELPEAWPEARKRAVIAGAFATFGRAGTRDGLRGSIRREAGLRAVIEEPIRHADWWLLPEAEAEPTGDEAGAAGCSCRGRSPREGRSPHEDRAVPVRGSRLGVSTHLAPAQPDGAIVGTTATADRSHLTSGTDYGAPLFAEVAYRFTVSLYAGAGLDEARLATVRRVLDREKPAHTDYAICAIEPRMRVGYQAVLGIDTVIAPEAPDRDPRGPGLQLGGERPGRIGARSRVGTTARLG